MKKELELGGEWELKPHWQELEELKNYTGRVVYKKKFNFSPEPERRYWLKLNGVFYWCAVYLNGFRLGANQGYFVPALFEITELLENGENFLASGDTGTAFIGTGTRGESGFQLKFSPQVRLQLLTRFFTPFISIRNMPG